MTDRHDLARLPEPELEAALRDLGRELAWPTVEPDAGADPAARARRRIEAASLRPGRGPWWARPARRRLGSSLGLAAAAVLLIAAMAAAIGFGLPGIRIIFGPGPTSSPTSLAPSASLGGSGSVPAPSPSSTPSVGPLGWTLGLGDPTPVATAAKAVDIPVRLPPATFGPPSTAWLLNGRLSLVWPAGPALPALREPGIGLILCEFRGSVDPGYFRKILEPGTTIETVRVGGSTGYWISGEPHTIVFVNEDGDPVFDTRRIVGDTLLWADGEVTFRLETGLDRDAAIALAESLR
jgi:hypothetical protein